MREKGQAKGRLMDLRGLVQGLIAPDPEPPAPYRRRRGALLVPEQRASLPSGKPQAIATTPGISDSPTWPYEAWSIESFAFDWTYTVASPLDLIEQQVIISFRLLIAGRPQWSETAEKRLPAMEGVLPTETIKGSSFTNLASPLHISGGEQISFTAEVEYLTKVEFELTQTVTIAPFQIPYSVDRG